MSIEQVPLVSTLLRAARDANEILLKETLRQILVNGISKEELNSTDNSGRVSFLIKSLYLKKINKCVLLTRLIKYKL